MTNNGHQAVIRPYRIVFDAVRPLTDTAAVLARRQIPVLLARIVAEAPGVRLRLDIDCDEQGVVSAAVTIYGRPHADRVATEIRPILAEVAEVANRRVRSGRRTGGRGGRAGTGAVWPVETVAATAGGLGFAPAAGGLQLHRWTPAAGVLEQAGHTAALAELVAVCPGHGIHADLAPATAADMWSVRVWVSAPASGPSLRARAAVRQMWPGLQLSDTRADLQSVPALQVTTDHLPTLVAVPVAGTDPVTGMTIGAPAPIPLTPVRAGLPGQGAALVRFGCGRTRTGHAVDVALTAHERLRHVHIVGRTGTGKSSLLAAIAGGIAASGEGLLLLDPHGTLVDRVAHELPAAALGRTWIVDSGDVHTSVPINPLAVDDPAARERAIDEVCAMFQYLFDKRETGVVGPRFHERVAMGLRALVALHGRRASILDVPLILANPDLMRQAAKMSQDARLAAWVLNDDLHRRASEYGDLVSWVNSKFEAFSSTMALRGILGSGADAFDMAEAMDERRIILVDLSKGSLGEPASRLLAFLHLNRVWQAALRRNTAAPFTVMVDEAHSVTAGALTSMLSEGRKFGVSVVLAHQYLGQLDDDLRPAVDGNVATTIGFRGAAADVPTLGARFGGTVAPETLMTLPDLSAVIVRTAAAAGTRPHTLEVDHNTRIPQPRVGATGRVDQARTITEAALATPYREVTIRARDGRSLLVKTSDHSNRITDPTLESESGSGSSFLDEWLAKRRQQHGDSYPDRPRSPQSTGKPGQKAATAPESADASV